MLKNSLTKNLQKLDRVRKLYKRFSITQISFFFSKKASLSTATGFINIYPTQTVLVRWNRNR